MSFKSLIFNGSNSQLDLSPEYNVFSRSFTMELWVKFNSTKSRQTFWGNYGNTSYEESNLERYGENLRVYWNKGQIHVNTPNFDFTPNKWAHVAWVNDIENNSMTVYQDGIAIFTRASLPPNNKKGRVSIGADYRGGSTVVLDGLIFEPRHWSVARTQNEIQNNMLFRLNNQNGLIANIFTETIDKNGDFDNTDSKMIGFAGNSDDYPEDFQELSKQWIKLSENEYATIVDSELRVSESVDELDSLQLPINLDILLTNKNKTLYDFIKEEYNAQLSLVHCTKEDNVDVVNIQTTHELNLLQDDLLQAEEIEILNWFENEEQAELIVQGELNSKFTHITELKNSSQIGKIVATDNNLGTKYLVSLDKKEWKRWNGADWEVVSWDNKDEINSLGMSKNTLKDITEEQWKLLGEEFYLGLYLNDHDSTIEQIDFQELIPNETPKIESGKLYILNTMAAIDVQLIGNKIFGNISDEDDNKVQYRVTLNGEPILPATGDFTDLHPQPQHINFRIPSEKIKMDDLNHLVIEFQDVWGSTDTWQESFIGTLSGLLFYDETGELYSDDVGNIQKMLDFGIVLAGQFSEPQKITLHNTLGHPVKDVKIYTDWGEEGKPQGTSMGYSPNDSPFTSTETISPALPMDDQEEFDFHVRLETDLHATDDVIGEMKICVAATEITDEEYEKLLEENDIE